MKSLRFALFLLAVLLVPLTNVFAQTAPADLLAGTEWRLVSSDGQEAIETERGSTPTLSFDREGNVSGYGGCNTFRGSYSVSERMLTVGALASTRRACVDEAQNTQESEFLAALGAASEFRTEEGQLIITYEGDKSLVLESVLSLPGTSWQLVSYGAPDAPTPVIDDSGVTLTFTDETAAGGSGGCNSYGGAYTLGSAGSIRFDGMASTLMACMDTAVMDQEAAYFTALNSASAYRQTRGQLIITYQDGHQLTFARVFALAGTEWTLVTYGASDAPTPVTDGSRVTLNFTDVRSAGGSGGCNSYGTSYETDGDVIRFGDIASTMMACDALMEQETAFFAALQNAANFYIEDDQLIIRYGEGDALVFSLVRLAAQ